MNPTLLDYQVRASETAIYVDAIKEMLESASPDAMERALRLSYATLGLVGEAGEIANKAKKVIRDNGGVVSDEVRVKLADELGDVLWYVAMLAIELDVKLSDIAERNIAKLKLRKQHDTLKGSGDKR